MPTEHRMEGFDEALPLIGPDGKLYAVAGKGDEPAVSMWLKWCERALRSMDAVFKVNEWCTDNAVHFRSIANQHPEAVASVKAAANRRVAEINAEPVEEKQA